MKTTPKISSPTFWDIDMNLLDFEKNAEWVITRVFDRGNLQEVVDIMNYYGLKRVLKTITTTERIHETGIDLAKAIFHISDDQFLFLKKKPSPLN